MPSTERAIFNFFKERNPTMKQGKGVIARVEKAVIERESLITSPYLETLRLKQKAKVSAKVSSRPRLGEGTIAARVQGMIEAGQSAKRVKSIVGRSPLQFQPEEAIAIVKQTAGSPRK